MHRSVTCATIKSWFCGAFCRELVTSATIKRGLRKTFCRALVRWSTKTYACIYSIDIFLFCQVVVRYPSNLPTTFGGSTPPLPMHIHTQKCI